MFDFLKNVGISDEVITEIIKNNSNSTVDNLVINSDNCLKVITYLREIGIRNIEELLIYRIDLFIQRFSRVKERIEKVNISELVKLVNDDCFSIDMIYD